MSQFSNDSLLATMLVRCDGIRAKLNQFEANQDEDSDEANEDNIEAARLALDNLESAIEDLIP
jgi:hypothetical protein